MESEIPRGIPRVLPLVRHRNHVGVVNVRPVAVAAVLALFGRSRLRRIAGKPIPLRIVIELFGPQESSKGLALDEDAVKFAVEGILLGSGAFFREAQFDRHATTWRNHGGIVRSSLSARLRWIHCIPVANDDVVVDAVLGIRWPGMSVEALRIRFIFRE